MSRTQTRLTRRTPGTDPAPAAPGLARQSQPLAAASTGTSGAALGALAEFLGVGADYMAQRQMRKNEESFASGEADARQDSVDETRRAKDRAYASAVVQVSTEAELARAFHELENSDELKAAMAEGNPEAVRGLVREVAGTFASDDEGVERVVTAAARRAESQFVTAAQQREAEIVNDGNFSDLTETAEAAYAAGEPLDYVGIAQRARALFGAEANTRMLTLLAEMAVNHADPDIIENFPEFIVDPETGQQVPSIKRIPRYAQRLRHAQAEATNLRNQANADETNVRKFLIRNSFYQRLDSGDTFSNEELSEVVRDGWLTAEQANSLARDRDRRREEVDLTAQFNAFAAANYDSGRASYYALLDAGATREQAEAAITGSMESRARRRAELLEASGLEGDDLAEAQRAAWTEEIVNLGQSYGFAYEPLRRQLAHPDPTNKERFGAGVALYNSLVAFDPEVARLHVPDDASRQKYTVATSLLDAGWSIEDVLAKMRPEDFNTRRTYYEGNLRTAVREELRGARFENPGSFFRTRGRRLEGPARDYLRVRAERQAEALALTGLYTDAEKLAEDAISMVQSMYAVTDGSVIPLRGNDPPYAKEALTWFRSELGDFLPEGLTPEDVVLAPDGATLNDRSTFGVYIKGTYQPAIDVRISLDELWEAYARRPDPDLTERNLRRRRREAAQLQAPVTGTGIPSDPLGHLRGAFRGPERDSGEPVEQTSERDSARQQE